MREKKEYFCVHCGGSVNHGKRKICEKPECKTKQAIIYRERQKQIKKSELQRIKGVKKVEVKAPARPKRFCIYVEQGNVDPCGKALKRNWFFCEDHHSRVDDYGMETL
jgi:hypothetical protein